MRSPNKRSRSKSNRPKTLGNIINRVFDSSGPEGKVRGTPQQIIEKYQLLARDAQLSNDRVAAENFQQHAEHYTRLLAQAQREMQAEQEARRQAHEERNTDRHQDRGQSNGNQNHHQNRRDTHRHAAEADAHGAAVARDTGSQSAFSVQDDDAQAEQGSLVETPESKADAPAEQPVADAQPAPSVKPARRSRAPKRAAKPADDVSEGAQAGDSSSQTQAEAGPDTAAAKPPRRYTRKSRNAEGVAATEPSQSAAE